MPTDRTDDVLTVEELRAIVEKMTPGPWEYFSGSIVPPPDHQGHFDHKEPDWIEWIQNGSAYPRRDIDGNGIVALRNHAMSIIDRLSARLAAAERVANAARDLRTVQRQRDRDEYEHCAAGATYGLDVLRIAEANLDDAIAGLEALK